MATDRTNEAPPDLEGILATWHAFRQASFACYDGVWVWSGFRAFEFYTTALPLRAVPDFSVRLDGCSMCIVAFGEKHWIPITQMTSDSLHHVQQMLCGEQIKWAEALRRQVHDHCELDETEMPDAAHLH